LWKIWFAPGSFIEYYPVEASVQALQWRLWHDATLGYHLTNLILHIASALLVWRLLGKFGLRFAWLGGLLFAIHPAVVESVAWMSELKNTLSMPPFLLAMCAWIDYEEHRRPRDYLLALGFFLVAMLCKVSMALFPLGILLYAWWKRGRVGWGDLRASLPFFLIGVFLGSMTVLAGDWFRESHLQSPQGPQFGDWLTHLALAGESIAFYFTKCIVPTGMLFIYPQWPIDSRSPVSFLPWIVLFGALLWFWTQRARWGRHALLGVGFFLINLAPFVGFTSVTYMAFTWVMDHLLYLPLIGLVGLAIAALENIEGRLQVAVRPLLITGVAVVFALLALESHDYAAVFTGPEKLWTYTLQRNPSSALARNNLGNILIETNRLPQAIDQYRAALRLNPAMVEAHNNLGFALAETGHLREAVEQYQLALANNPHFVQTQINLGDLLLQMGRTQEAAEQYRQALLVNPHDEATRAKLARLQALPKTSR
jgi:tetratricopeptide (TPR) repeat protein